MNTSSSLVFVLFGATGDLAQKKIMPALLSLFQNGKLPKDTTIVAFSRRPWSDDEYRAFIAPSLENPGAFLEKIVYVQGTFDAPQSYESLAKRLAILDERSGKSSQKLFHLSIQPEFYTQVAEGLSRVELLSMPSKLLIEKPFGQDLESAEYLEKVLESVVHQEEQQLFRIDHYLGKPGLWNILEARQHDVAFETKLNNKNVASVSIRLFEHIGIEGRGEFYDTVGAVRDVVQNHCLEMLALAIMEIPSKETPETIRQARSEVLKNLKPIKFPNETAAVIRGQYEGYLQETDVPQDSETETYIKIQTEVATSRWHGVPIIIEAGKAMKEKRSEVEFLFNDGSRKIFNMDVPPLPSAYEVVIDGAIHNNVQYFVSLNEVLASWEFVMPILEHMKTLELKKYSQGTNP